METTNEKEIIKGIIDGDETILKSFYQYNLPLVKNYILKQGGSTQDTEDIFQDALVLLYLKLRSDNTIIKTTVNGFFYGICKNLWFNHARKERKWGMAEILDDQYQDDTPTISEELFQKDRQNLFNTYFVTLKDTTKQLWQYFFEEKSSKEIAFTMGYSETYVRKKKYDTKKRMIQKISKDPVFKELVEI
ncbi:RNA polymerase sigma factor [Aquimarina litoralis]|uniref:RNA polymerase sigma factor n=1 Tax=Aquimarina litoralis TaxID=584605 RepID=UPI001C56D7AB|nr:sigma-70 family RNA polymerase sigma factor [Aquimarina litoralis]MBW1295743.1 sigma-70 family RNA polymerase sigma factor [Aquimarina litoralis]